MTNNIHIIEIAPAYAPDDTERFSIMTPFIFNEMTDDDALSIMRPAAIALAEQCLDDARRLANNDFSDDDTDYMPARANMLAALISSLATVDMTPSDALRNLLHNYDFIQDALTADFSTDIDIDWTD